MPHMTYIDLMVRAVQNGDTETLALLAIQLQDCEDGKQIMRAKGYGVPGTSMVATARLVPLSKGESAKQ